MAKKKETENEKVIIDVDVIIETYNKKNPEKRQMTRASLAEELGVHPQLFVDWKRGKTPNIVPRLIKLMELSGCKLADFVKENEE